MQVHILVRQGNPQVAQFLQVAMADIILLAQAAPDKLQSRTVDNNKMTYTTHSLILHDDYNTFVTGTPDGTANPLVANINTIWGTGYGSKGYGQTTTISPAAIGTTISATQWSALIAKLAPIAAHQGSTLQYIPQPTVGNTISVVGALNSTLLLLYNNSMNKSASGTDTNTYGSTYIAHGWKVQQVATHTVYFTNGPDAARYFFHVLVELQPQKIQAGLHYYLK
jgi:hypothetical protein